jgi:hypothetical protein
METIRLRTLQQPSHRFPGLIVGPQGMCGTRRTVCADCRRYPLAPDAPAATRSRSSARLMQHQCRFLGTPRSRGLRVLRRNVVASSLRDTITLKQDCGAAMPDLRVKLTLFTFTACCA